MKSLKHLSGVFALGTLLFANSIFSGQEVELASSSSASTSRTALNAYNDSTGTSASGAAFIKPVRVRQSTDARLYRPFTHWGLAWRGGLSGAGFDVATTLAPKLNLRAGVDLFSHNFFFQEEGANVNAGISMRSAHASVDWFPFRRTTFRVSPMMVFGNNNLLRATASIPSGSTLSINGGNYVSSDADPLNGWLSVGFRKVSPGLTIGFGNMIPRGKKHFSVPIEAGFYYVGQPTLKVNFAGSACDPNYPQPLGCQPVSQDAGFQHDLQSFVTRNNHNLGYASFFPVFSSGFSYRF